jgi:RNA processing factor Prp31
METTRLVWTAVLELVDLVVRLDEKRQVLRNLMDEEAGRITLKLCTLVGRLVAGRLITAADWLRALAEMPLCNVQGLGS